MIGFAPLPATRLWIRAVRTAAATARHTRDAGQILQEKENPTRGKARPAGRPPIQRDGDVPDCGSDLPLNLRAAAVSLQEQKTKRRRWKMHGDRSVWHEQEETQMELQCHGIHGSMQHPLHTRGSVTPAQRRLGMSWSDHMIGNLTGSPRLHQSRIQIRDRMFVLPFPSIYYR